MISGDSERKPKEYMAPGSRSSDYPVVISKAAEADWSYHGDEWTKKSSIKLDSGNNVFGLAKDTNFLSGSWIASPGQSSFAPSDLMGGITNGYHGDLEDRLSSFLQDKLSLSAPDTTAIGGSRINMQSIKNQQFEFSGFEWQTISSLLPSDDEFFSSVVTDQDGSNTANFIGENEELDLFSSGGGMELEGEAQDLSRDLKKGVDSLSVGGTPSGIGEHPFGEHPSRTLFVRNINSSVEDSELRTLFEQYGDIRTLYTACKHRGFVMISYYDIRAARSALRALQNKALRRRKLDIHFSIPKDNPSDKDVNQGTLVVFNLDASVSNDDLLQIFGVYGEVKEIRETPHKRHHKFIEFYDVRSAEAALRALNRCDIAGKRIKLEPSRPGGVRKSLMQHLTHELEQEESSNASSPVTTKSSSVHDSPFTENIQSVKASSSLGYAGRGMNPASYGWPNTFSEFGHGLVEAVQHSPATTISALKAQMISNNLTKMGISNFSNVPLLRSPNGGLLPASLQACSLESLPVNGLLGNSLNSLYRKDISAAQSLGVSGFVNHFPFVDVNPNNGSSPSTYHHHHHHPVGSAPVAPFPLLDRHQTFFRESLETPLSINSGSLGVVFGRKNSMEPQFSSSLGRVMPNTILGNGFVDHTVYPNLWLMSQQPKGSSISKPAVDAASDWGGMERGSRSRKTDNPLAQHDRKQYELDIEKILQGGDIRTTLMIKNIPNKYTSKMLLAAIDEQHKGAYDFIYLPIDFKNKCNVGYAFINMTEPSKIVSFYQAFNGKRWEKFNSEKVASLAYARIQGKSALVAHFQNSSLMNEDKRCRPILFHSGGPNIGDQEAFPVGPNPRMRLGKTRGGASVNHSISINSSNKDKVNHGF